MHTITIDTLRLLSDTVPGSPLERLTLLTLADNEEPMRLTDLCNRVGMSRAAMTSIGDRLEQAGLAKRHHPSIGEDRRVVRLAITKKGARAVERAQDQAELEQLTA